jgi:predicted KAP-like P-loop ATPase
LFERLGNADAYKALVAAASASDEGKPAFLAEWEKAAAEGKEFSTEAPWDGAFERDWLALTPQLHDKDLRGALYVSREHAPLITPEDRLSSDAAELLTALVEHPGVAATHKEKLAKLPRAEIDIIMTRLLDRARQEQAWGVPDILEACLAVSEADPAQGPRLASFLRDRPVAQIQPNIVPKIADQAWSKPVLEAWKTGRVSLAVKRAIGRVG